MSENTPTETTRPKRRRRPNNRPPRLRDCKIYQRHIVQNETQERVAAAFGVTQQRVGQIAARVEAWLARHAEHPLAQRMRLRTSRRWEAIWSRAIDSFDRSREDRETKKERSVRKTTAGEDPLPVTTVTERTVRQQNGDPRFLSIATRVAEREDRVWRQEEAVEGSEGKGSADDGSGAGQNSHEFCYAGRDGAPSPVRFPYLPATLWDLEHLACGLRNPAAAAEDDRGATAQGAAGENREATVPVSTLFEQRCAEAFRILGFEVRELGQGCGRVADCLAVAAVERFAVIIDAKVRRRGYALRTDDRQFCEYAARHTRELALSGIEKVYFAVVGRGFRQEDLDKLAGLMTGTPIRSVCFIEAQALMRLVHDSIARRREFRLDQIDRLLFGNKIIEA